MNSIRLRVFWTLNPKPGFAAVPSSGALGTKGVREGRKLVGGLGAWRFQGSAGERSFLKGTHGP